MGILSGLTGNASLRRRIRTAAVPLLICGWIIPPLWSIVSLRAVNIPDDIYASDMINNMLPCRALSGEKLRRGEYPTWTPGIYTGYPLLASIETGALYPTNVLFFTLFSPYVAIMLAQILALLVAGCSLYFLAREYELPVAASLFGAGAFCLSGFFISHLRHPSMIDAACWIPLQLLLLERLIARRASPRAPLWLALVWAVQILAGHPQISYYAGVVIVVVMIVRWRQEDRRRIQAQRSWPLRFVLDGAVHRFVVAIALGGAMAGAQLVPSAELVQLAHRGGGLSYEEASIYPAAPRNVLTLVLPKINGDPSDGTYKLSAAFWEEYAYLGVLPLLFALAAVALCWRKRPIVKLFACLAVLAYLLALGKHTPLHRVVHWAIPGMAYFRFPTRFLVFVELSLAVLGAVGLAEVLDRLKSRKVRGALVAAVFLLTAADLWHHQSRQIFVADMQDWTAPIKTEQFLSSKRDSAMPWRYYSLEAMRVHALTYKTSGGWAVKAQPYVQLREILQPSFNLLFGHASVDGYVNPVPGHFEAVWGSAASSGWVHPPGHVEGGVLVPRRELVNSLRAFNTRYVVSPYRLNDRELTEVFSNGMGVGVYEVRGFLPRAFVVGATVQVKSASAARRIFAAADFDPAGTAVVHEPVRLPGNAASSRRVSYEPISDKQVKVRVRLDRPGLLVLSDAYYPGWRAALDGREVPIIRANVMMRAVVVPGGRHEVVFTYASPAVRWGAAVSVLGVIALLILGRVWLRAPPGQQGDDAGPSPRRSAPGKGPGRGRGLPRAGGRWAASRRTGQGGGRGSDG